MTWITARACEEWEGVKAGWDGKLTKQVNVDVPNNKVTITVTVTKKGADLDKEIRFIEMIGPKAAVGEDPDDAYEKRFLLGGPHKTIAAGQATGKVVWEITKNDIPDIRIGSIGDCTSCHADRPVAPHDQNEPDCTVCHNANNTLPLDEWNDPNEYPIPTDQQFKDWLQGMEDRGWAEYLDYTAGYSGDGENGVFKTFDKYKLVEAEEDTSSERDIHPHNHWDDGSFRLELVYSAIPAGWTFNTDPPLGESFFLLHDQHIPVLATFVPDNVAEGDEAVVYLCNIREDTGECVHRFTLRIARDTTPPTYSGQVASIVGSDILVQISAQDQPATVSGAQVFYSLNSAPEVNAYMDIVSDSCDPVDFEYRIGPLVPGTNILQYYVNVEDELGNTTQTSVKNELFEYGGPIPTVSEWGLVVMSLVMLTAGTLVYSRRRPAPA